MTQPPINIDYWAALYEWSVDDNDEYEVGIDKSNFIERVDTLWGWKNLNRWTAFEEVESDLDDLDMEQYLQKPPADAVEALRNKLQGNDDEKRGSDGEEDPQDDSQDGIINGDSLVTPGFLLHLSAFDFDEIPPEKFPIYDVRVWNAYVYLWNLRPDSQSDSLYADASTSPSKYGDFCTEFRETCPSNVDPRWYEQALFMFGQFIMDVNNPDGTTEITEIDAKLEQYETVIQESQSTNGFALAKKRL